MKSSFNKSFKIANSKIIFWGFVIIGTIATYLIYSYSEELKIKNLEKELAVLQKEQTQLSSDANELNKFITGRKNTQRPTDQQLKNDKRFVCFLDAEAICTNVSILIPPTQKYCLLKNQDRLSSQCKSEVLAAPTIYTNFFKGPSNKCQNDLDQICAFVPESQSLMKFMCLLDYQLSISSDCRNEIKNFKLPKVHDSLTLFFQNARICNSHACKADTDNFCKFVSESLNHTAYCLITNLKFTSNKCQECVLNGPIDVKKKE